MTFPYFYSGICAKTRSMPTLLALTVAVERQNRFNNKLTISLTTHVNLTCVIQISMYYTKVC